MKNLIKIFCLFVLSSFAQAQEKEPVAPKDYTATMDSLLRYVKKR